MTTPKEAMELKPCPFCGSSATIECYGNASYSTVYTCDECGCRLETGEEFNHGTQWNTRATPSLEGDAVERVARIIAGPLCDATKGEHSVMAQGNYRFCTQCGETISSRTIGIIEARNKARAILATGLVPDEAAIRAELSEVRQEATDSLRVLDAIADYVGCPHDEELSVDHVRQHYMKLENAAQRQGIEDAARIANAQAYVTVNEAAVRANNTANLISIIADIREKTGLGGKPMLNELADAIVAEMDRRVADEREKQRERDAEIADCIGDKYDATSFMSPNAEQVAALRSKEQAAHDIAAAIRSGGGQ